MKKEVVVDEEIDNDDGEDESICTKIQSIFGILEICQKIKL